MGERGIDDGPIRAEFGRALSIGSNTCVMLTTSGHRRIITPARHPFRFRVVGHASSPKGYAPPPRSETPVAVTPRLYSERATSCLTSVLNHMEELHRGIDAIRAAQGFVRFEIEKTPDESEHVYTYAGGYSALTAIADTVARVALDVGDCVQEFLKAAPDLESLMNADATPPARADCSQKAA